MMHSDSNWLVYRGVQSITLEIFSSQLYACFEAQVELNVQYYLSAAQIKQCRSQ